MQNIRIKINFQTMDEDTSDYKLGNNIEKKKKRVEKEQIKKCQKKQPR